MTGHGKKYTSKFPTERYGETAGCSECLSVSSQHKSRRREKLDRVAQPETVQHVHQNAGTKRGAEDHPTSSSAKRAHAIPPPMSRILLQSEVEMGTVPVLEDAMEVELDVGVVPASVRRDAKRTSSTWEERADQVTVALVKIWARM